MPDIIQKIIDNTHNFSMGRRGNAIIGIVLHTEAAPRIEGMEDRSLYNWFNTNSRGVSAHYYVTFGGKIEQYVLDSDTAHQAGNWEFNLRTIGIEHQDNGFFRADNRKYTDAEYEASAQLVASLCLKYNIPIQFTNNTGFVPGIRIHNQVPGASTACPGALDFQRIIDRAQEIAGTAPADPTVELRPLDSPPPVATAALDFPLRGLHGDSAADWLSGRNVKGWAVETVYSQGDLANIKPQNYTAHEAKGIRVIVRWNYSFGTDAAGGAGTFPKRDQYEAFATWCANSIKESTGVWGHIIGNEPNRAAERPAMDDPITAADVINVYNRVWDKLQGGNHRLSPPAVDPTNIETDIPNTYWREILQGIRGAGFFALHAVSYGSDQPVDSDTLFQDPRMNWQFYSFRMWQPLAKIVNEFQRYRQKPLIITETNHLHRRNQPTQTGWDADAAFWIVRMYEYLKRWNQASAGQYIYGACLYRFDGDQWRIRDLNDLLTALSESGDQIL